MVTYFCQNCNQSAGELPRVGILNDDQMCLCESCYKSASPLEKKWFYFEVQNEYKQWCLVGKINDTLANVKKAFKDFYVYVEQAGDTQEIWLILAIPSRQRKQIEHRVKNILGYGQKAKVREDFARSA